MADAEENAINKQIKQTSSQIRKKEETTRFAKRSLKKRKNNLSPEPSTSSKNDELVAIIQSKKKMKLDSDEEWEEMQDITNSKETCNVRFDMTNEESIKTFKFENCHYNLHSIVIDEICLEGLDGITLEALWTRLSVALNYPLPFPINVTNFFWNNIIKSTDIQFFKLNEPRLPLVIYDRFKERDPDLGEIIDPVEAPLDIYPYSPVIDTNLQGSASSFNTRIDITEDVRELSLIEAEQKYKSQLVIVASQRLRRKAIFSPLSDPVVEYTSIQYCLLERIARSRYLGEITQGKVSLQVMSKDPKVIFYHRKILAENNLITKQPFNLKTPNANHLSGTLFHICRFYNEQKTKTMTLTQNIVECLRSKPNYCMEYAEVKKTFGHVKVLKKLFKLPEFQRFIKTDVPRFCRELYPDDSDKWLCIGSNKEKIVRTLELIDPNINVSRVWYEDDPKDESSDEETRQELMFKTPILHQIYDFIRQSGRDGCSLKDIQANKGLDFYSTRAAINQLLNQKLITGVKIDIGRQRLMRYQTVQLDSPDVETINVEDQQEKAQLELEAVEFLSDLLQVDSAFVIAPIVDSNFKPKAKESEYDTIRTLRQQSRETSESGPTSIATYKNQHDYSMLEPSFVLKCESDAIPQFISEGIIRSWGRFEIKPERKKKLAKSFQKFNRNFDDDKSYIKSILSVKCPLAYQSLVCEESYQKLLKNCLKLTRAILVNSKNILRELLPRKRHTCKQQLTSEELRALTESHPLAVGSFSEISPTSKRKFDVVDETVKKAKPDEDDVNEVKEIYMGPKPSLTYEVVDLDGISVSVWVSTTPEEFTDTFLPYIKENNATLRTIQRANLILNAVKRETVITDVYRLHRDIQNQEQEEGYNVKADRKSFNRIYTRLVRSGLIKILQIVLKSLKMRRVITVLCDTSLDVHHTIIKSLIEQLKMKIFLPKKKSIQLGDNETSQGTKTFDTSEISSSVGELKMLVDGDYKFMRNRTAGKNYGHVPKFLRMHVLHEFLFHIIYNSNATEEVVDVKAMLAESDISMNENEIEEMPTVYCREVGWKMFVPPLTTHAGWPEGWALVCDLLLRLPLSLFVKLCNVTLIIPDLTAYLEHSVKQHYLVKYLPIEIRSGLLHQRKYIFSIHETLCRLAYVGLLQFGPQKLREKDQVFIFLNRNASLYDTTTSCSGYHYVEDKEYKKTQYRFLTCTDVETYWYEMWNICTHTNLGVRTAVVGTYITIEQLETKPAMIDTLKPQIPETALINDNGNIPGDRRGAAGLDSALWSHVKRNWNMTGQCGQSSASIKRLRKLKKLKKSKKEQLKNKKVPLNSQRKRKPIVIRKVKERAEQRNKKKKGYDSIDKKLMENLRQSRSEWNYEEDLLLNICKLISIFLCPNFRKQIIHYTVIRDTLHKLLPCSVNKTSGACQRRVGVLFGSTEQQEYLQQIVKALICIPFVKKYFQKIFNRVQKGMFLKERQLHGAFVFLVIYFFENQHELQHIFETIDNKSSQSQFKSSKSKTELPAVANKVVCTLQTTDSQTNVLAYSGLENGRTAKSLKLYPNTPIFPKSETDIILDSIKSIIHSTVAVRPDDASCVYQLFRVYQGYSDELLKIAVNDVRNSQMIIAKRTPKKQTDMKGLPISSKLFHFSFYYSFTQVTKFPVELFLQSHEFFLGVYAHREKLLPSFGNGLPTECFQQGHVISLSEIVTNVSAHFIVDFPKEVLILNPRIADHTELIRELAVRYMKMLTLIKDGSYFKDDQQGESSEKQLNRTPMIQRFLKTWFLSSDKEEDNENVCIQPFEENASNRKHDKKRVRTMQTSNIQLLKSLSDDIHQQNSSKTLTSRDKLKSVPVAAVDSFEDYEKKLESLLSSKTIEAERGSEDCARERAKNEYDADILKRYLNTGKQQTDNNSEASLRTSVEDSVLVQNVDNLEGDSYINARMESIMNENFSIAEIMKGMLDDSPSEERKVPSVIKLSRLLVKGLFPDLDEDEEKLERLHQHFLVVCPDTNLTIDSFENNDELTYLHNDHPLVCKNLLCRVQKDIIVNEQFPSDDDFLKKCKLLDFSDRDTLELQMLIQFICEKNFLGASTKELKKRFSSLSSQKLSFFLKTLIDMNVILRTGIIYLVFVHYRHRKHWLVESCTLEYQDKMKLEKSNTGEILDVDIPALAKTLESYTEMKLFVKPWARIDGTLNLKLFEKWLCTVLGLCLADMSISLTTIINACSFLKPVDVYYLIECLQDVGCLKMSVFPVEKCWLTTESTYIESVDATIVDDFQDIFIDTDKMAIIKFGTLLNKKLKEFDFPTDVAKKHDTF